MRKKLTFAMAVISLIAGTVFAVSCKTTEQACVHEGGTATCIKKAVCEKCGEEYGELAAHNYGTEWKSDGEKHWKECLTEGCTAKGEENSHVGGTATCLKKAVCTTCGAEYGELAEHNYGDWVSDGEKHWKECLTEGCTAKSEEGAHNYALWDKSGSAYDYKACECGAVDKTQRFAKTSSFINQNILLSGSSFAIRLDGVGEYASVESIKLGDYDLGKDISALTISDELKADTAKHGKQKVTVTVKDAAGETHEIRVPVTFITSEISTAEQLKAIQPTENKKGIYGYYLLTNDISDNSLAGSAYSGDWEETTGFFGTLDGQGYTVSMAANAANGLFGILRGATIKNLTVKDNWRSAYQYYALLAKATYNSMLENVTFTLVAGNSKADVGDGYGWISYSEFSGNTLINVTVNDSKGYGSLFGFKFINNTFDNVTINGTYTEMGHTADVVDKDGNITEFNKSVSFDEVIKAERLEQVKLENRQDFVLDGRISVIDLGKYADGEIVSIVTSTGYELDSLSSAFAGDAFKAAKQAHGEQNLIVTMRGEDKNYEVIVPVTVITKVVTTMNDLQTATKHKGANLYGYYILGNDVSVDEEGYKAENATYAWNAGTGFAGTVDGRGFTITMQGNKSQHGLFGTLHGATIKNVKIVNKWYSGWSTATLGYTAYNTTFENVRITVYGSTVGAPTGGAKIGVIVGAETGGCSWKNVTINVDNAQHTLFHTLNKDNKKDTFENVTVTIPSLTQFSDVGTPEGVTIKAE